MAGTDHLVVDVAGEDNCPTLPNSVEEPELLQLQNISRLGWEAREALLQAIEQHVSEGGMVREKVSAARSDLLEDVKDRVIKKLALLGYTENDQVEATIILEEMLVDGQKHGSEMRPDREVRVTHGHVGDHFGVLISDDGDGFDIYSIPNPTHPDNLERPGGRGIMLSDDFIGPAHLGGSAQYLPIGPTNTLCNQVYLRFPVKILDQSTVETKIL